MQNEERTHETITQGIELHNVHAGIELLRIRISTFVSLLFARKRSDFPSFLASNS